MAMKMRYAGIASDEVLESDEYFLLDNRNNSSDSRSSDGPVSRMQKGMGEYGLQIWRYSITNISWWYNESQENDNKDQSSLVYYRVNYIYSNYNYYQTY